LDSVPGGSYGFASPRRCAALAALFRIEVTVNDLEYHLLEEARSGRMSRQQLLVRASVLGISLPALSAILAACGSSSSSSSTAASSSPGAVKRGGTFRLGVTQPAQDV